MPYDYTVERKKVKSISRVRLFGTPWTVAYQAPPSVGFSRQGYWSELPFPPPGDLSDPGLQHCRQGLYPLSLQGRPYTVEVADRWKRLDLIDRVPAEL